MDLPKSPSAQAIAAIGNTACDLIRRADTDPTLVEYLKYHHHRLALDYDWIRRNVGKESSILEVGGFPFFLSQAILDDGHKLDVIDTMSPLASILVARGGPAVSSCNIETEPLPYPDGVFDEVLFNEVFEHLRINPIYTMRQVLRVLKPGGRVWLSTPNLGSLRGVMNLAFRDQAWTISGEGVFDQYAHLEKHGWMGHVREYTSTEVSDFIERVGFRLRRVVYRGEYKSALASLAASIYPRLLPYFSCIATK